MDGEGRARAIIDFTAVKDGARKEGGKEGKKERSGEIETKDDEGGGKKKKGRRSGGQRETRKATSVNQVSRSNFINNIPKLPKLEGGKETAGLDQTGRERGNRRN